MTENFLQHWIDVEVGDQVELTDIQAIEACGIGGTTFEITEKQWFEGPMHQVFFTIQNPEEELKLLLRYGDDARKLSDEFDLLILDEKEAGSKEELINCGAPLWDEDLEPNMVVCEYIDTDEGEIELTYHKEFTSAYEEDDILSLITSYSSDDDTMNPITIITEEGPVLDDDAWTVIYNVSVIELNDIEIYKQAEV